MKKYYGVNKISLKILSLPILTISLLGESYSAGRDLRDSKPVDREISSPTPAGCIRPYVPEPDRPLFDPRPLEPVRCLDPNPHVPKPLFEPKPPVKDYLYTTKK